jgi:hypothetical protein
MTYARLASAAAALFAVLAALVTATSAVAGQYTVYGCRTPDGAVAPTNGWSPSTVGAWQTVDNGCAVGGGLKAEMNSDVPHQVSDEARWTFHAPENTRIVSFAGQRSVRVGAGQTNGVPGAVLGQDPSYLEYCFAVQGCPSRGSFDSWNSPGNAFSYPGLDTSTVYLAAFCGGTSGGTCPAESTSTIGVLYRAHVVLSDTSDPQPANLSGELVQPGDHRGTQAATFNVTDQGSGAYRGIVELDGATIEDHVIDANAGRCTDAVPGDGDPYEFVDRQPCKLAANVTIALNTTRVADGDHTIRVSVADAAGNSATVFGPAAFRVVNRAASSVRGNLNGTNASDSARLTAIFAGNRRQTLTTRFARRVVVSGRLVNERDQGIGNASLEIASTNAVQGARAIAGHALTTAPDGSFSVTLPVGACSRRIRIAYRSHLGDAPVAATNVSLRVRAGVRLSIRPRAVHNRQAITLRGRLRGGPVPRGGKLVEMQVRFPTGWRTFATTRANRRGAFRYRYRFLRSYQPVTYRFRARARHESSYPYETGVSPVIPVRVR